MFNNFDWEYFFQKLHEFIIILKVPQLITDEEI